MRSLHNPAVLATFLLIGLSSLSAQTKAIKPPGAERSPLHLPLETVFKGEGKFQEIVAKAQREEWAKVSIGDRAVLVGQSLVGTPYKRFTLEIHDRVESPSANLLGLDCWTFFEISMGFARMLETPKARYAPVDLLREIETTRYRAGQCNGDYLERIHYLAEWYVDNEARGTINDLTRQLGGVPFHNRKCSEMTTLWRSYRYLKNNPSLRPLMAQHEKRVSALPIHYIPKDKVAGIERHLKNGDVIGIATKHQGGFCSHVGLAYRSKDGKMRLMHASSDAKKVIIDVSIHEYLHRYDKHAGILVGRPQPLESTVRDPRQYETQLRQLTSSR